MISLCPNRRASSEYLPGPRKTMAMIMMPVKTSDNFASKRFGAGAGNSANPTPRVHKPATTPATGVSRPMSNAAPDASPIAAAIHAAVRVSDLLVR